MSGCADGSAGAGLGNPVVLTGRTPSLSATLFSANDKLTAMRICSFLPSATGIVCALGLTESLVGARLTLQGVALDRAAS